MAKSELLQTPVKSGDKSWVELCDNFYYPSSSDDEDMPNKIEIKTEIKEEVVEENGEGDNITAKFVSKATTTQLKTELKQEKQNSPLNFTYASILKNSANKSNRNSPKTPVKTEKIDDSNNERVKSVKREIQKAFLHEDLSISSHLDIFHMESPLKLEPIDESMTSPLKLGRKRGCPPKLMMDEDAVMPDDLLMPSPKKVTRLSTRRSRESGESPLNCKRPKRSSGSSNVHRVLPLESPSVEFETDEQVLARRQKQIDYGKNTIGYERYCQMVPKDKRHRKHPSTPPRHIKYSRRAWDGLIKQWRQQLHFWDPPSEGGGNIDEVDISSMSDTSSTTMSQPATPRDVRKTRRQYSRVSARSSTSECSSITDDSGCSPLIN